MPFTQDEVTVSGHAIEARVYAEDSFGGFLPQAGTASLVRWPVGDGVRVDAALEPEGVVSTAYDPMLGKVIAHGPDRESARQALVAALDETVILGLTTNAGFLRALVASDEFRDATIDTAWLDHHEVPAPDPEVPRMLVAWISAMLASLGPPHPFQSDGFRLGGPPAPTLVELDRDVVVDRVAGTVDGIPVSVLSAENHVIEALVDGHHVRAVVNVQPTSPTSPTGDSGSTSPRPTASPTPSRRATARSPRRCPAPSSTSGSRSVRPWPRATCSASSRR